MKEVVKFAETLREGSDVPSKQLMDEDPVQRLREQERDICNRHSGDVYAVGGVSVELRGGHH